MNVYKFRKNKFESIFIGHARKIVKGYLKHGNAVFNKHKYNLMQFKYVFIHKNLHDCYILFLTKLVSAAYRLQTMFYLRIFHRERILECGLICYTLIDDFFLFF